MNSYFHIHLFRAILRLSSKLVPVNYEQSLKITILYEAELLSITSSSTANVHTTICPSYQQPNSNETQQYKVGLNSLLLIWQLSLALTIIRIKQRNCNCSTPNPYPSQIHPVWVSIIIVKISLLLYSTTPPVKHLCRKNSIAEPPLEISTSNFLGYVHIALT